MKTILTENQEKEIEIIEAIDRVTQEIDQDRCGILGQSTSHWLIAKRAKLRKRLKALKKQSKVAA